MVVGGRLVRCSKCKKGLFYLSNKYDMATAIVCVECVEKNGKKKKKTTRTASCNYARTKKGIRPDIHSSYYFRSAMEANFARILKHLGIKYKFEERVFPFHGYKNKPFQYLPDFEVPRGQSKGTFSYGFYETKGYMQARSRNQLRRFKKNYPKEASKLTVVVYSKYNKAAIEFCKKLGFRYLLYDELTKKYANCIDHWESN